MYPIEKYQFKTYEKVNKDGSKSTVVVALSTYCGKVVKGVAKCLETDKFSLEDGMKLAAARCDAKVCEKRYKRADIRKSIRSRELDEIRKEYESVMEYYRESMDEYLKSLQRLKEIETKMN